MNTAQNNGKDKRRIAKRLTAAVLAVVMISLAAMSVRADSTDCVVALGADLSASERAVVLEGLGLTEETLAKNKVITVTNAEEHEYLDSYLLGEQMVVDGDLVISDVYVDEAAAEFTYRFTDIYNQEYWTTPAP